MRVGEGGRTGPINRGGADRRTADAVSLGLAVLGLSAFVSQLLLLREALALYSGNELVLGVVLGNWLLLTGVGSFFGRYAARLHNPLRWVLFGQAGIAILPLAQIVLFRSVNQWLTRGMVLGLGESFATSLLLLLPFCVLSGFLVTLLSGLISEHRDPAQVGAAYMVDTLGGVVGGLVFCFGLVYLFTPLQTASFLLVLNLLAGLYLGFSSGRRTSCIVLGTLLIICLGVVGVTDLERLTTRAMFPGSEVLLARATPYGNLTVTRNERQITVYENGIPLGSSHDTATAEEIVHYALAQHAEPKNVLLVSGGVSGAHVEVAKYPIERLDYVELDPAILELVRLVGGLESDPRVRLIAADARRFIRSRRNEYDAVLMATADPSSAQLNRLYTFEFFREVRRALRPNGVFSFSLSGAENYANPEVRILASAVHRALQEVFPNILIVPGARQYFVASDHVLRHDVGEQLSLRGIETSFVHGDYLTARFTEDRLAEARRMVSATVEVNRDFLPVSYYAHLRHWMRQFGSGLLIPLLVVVGLFLVAGVSLASSRDRAVPAALCASGFAGMGLEVVLLIAFQVCYGYVYLQAGLIILGFMIGAAVGAGWACVSRTDPGRLLFRLDVCLGVAAFLVVPLLVFIAGTENGVLHAVAPPLIFPFITGLVGLFVGAQFPPAARLIFRGVENTTGTLFGFDLVGACLGAFVVSAFCVPLLGVPKTCCLIGGIKLVSAAALWVRQRDVSSPLSARAVPSFESSLSFAVILFVFTVIGVMIVAEETSGGIYALSFSPAYYWLLVILMAVGILRATAANDFTLVGGKLGDALQRLGRAVRTNTRLQALRWVYYFTFAIAVFYPIFRCYFVVPYLFCHACPRKCIFGFVRPFLVPAALIMNLERRFWCYNACPIGTLFDCQARVARGRPPAGRVLRVVSLTILVFVAVAYFKVMWDLEAQPTVEHDWYTFFFRNMFAVSTVVILVAGGLILLCYRLRRPFCEALCPVGALSDLIQIQERTLMGEGSGAHNRGGTSEVSKVRS